MLLQPGLDTKSLFETTPGELVAIELRTHRAIALVIEQTQKECWVAVLQSGEVGLDPPPPITFPISRRIGSKSALSYGTDWVLELIPGDESFPGNKREYQTPGAIYLDVDGPRLVLNAGEDRSFSDIACINLDTNGFTELSDTGAPHLHWRIWHTGDEYLRPSGNFITEFTGTSKAKRQRP